MYVVFGLLISSDSAPHLLTMGAVKSEKFTYCSLVNLSVSSTVRCKHTAHSEVSVDGNHRSLDTILHTNTLHTTHCAHCILHTSHYTLHKN